MSEKTKQMLFSGIKIFLKAVLTFVIITFYYLSCFISWVFENCAILVEKMLIKLGVFEQEFAPVVNKNFMNTDPLFTPEEIKSMATSLPENVETVDEIRQHFKISHRQAYKVKCARNNIDNSPEIQRLTA